MESHWEAPLSVCGQPVGTRRHSGGWRTSHWCGPDCRTLELGIWKKALGGGGEGVGIKVERKREMTLVGSRQKKSDRKASDEGKGNWLKYHLVTVILPVSCYDHVFRFTSGVIYLFVVLSLPCSFESRNTSNTLSIWTLPAIHCAISHKTFQI